MRMYAYFRTQPTVREAGWRVRDVSTEADYHIPPWCLHQNSKTKSRGSQPKHCKVILIVESEPSEVEGNFTVIIASCEGVPVGLPKASYYRLPQLQPGYCVCHLIKLVKSTYQRHRKHHDQEAANIIGSDKSESTDCWLQNVSQLSESWRRSRSGGHL